MNIILANPRGFCAGVNRSINILERILEIYGAPIYVLHELVHNSYVIDSFSKSGVVFVEEIDEVPKSSIIVFSAHGVSQNIRDLAYNRGLKIFDATCPLVMKVHHKVIQASKNNIETILIGHSGHPEVNSTLGQYHNTSTSIYLVGSKKDVLKIPIKKKNNFCIVTQTTLSESFVSNIMIEIHKRFPNSNFLNTNDICYATFNRQHAIRKLVNHADIVLVVGSNNSSNANRLLELSKSFGKNTFLINNYLDIKKNWLKDVKNIGITSGASTPEILIHQVIIFLKKIGIQETIELSGKKENFMFKLPRNLQKK